MISENAKTIERKEIESLVVERAKSLERDDLGGYRLKKPHRGKSRTTCEFCKEDFVNLDRHIEKKHNVGA